MLAIIIKKILKIAKVSVTFSDGDLVKVEIQIGNKVVMDRTFDVIKGA